MLKAFLKINFDEGNLNLKIGKMSMHYWYIKNSGR